MLQIHERLRQARHARGFELSELARRTRLGVHLFDALEQGQYQALPRGLYARAVIRSYAEAVGLDADAVVAEVVSLLPEVEDPLDGLARVRGLERQPKRTVVTADPVPELSSLTAREALATAIDSGLLASIDLSLLGASAWACGVTVERLLEVAAPAMLMMFALIAGLYFLLLAGVAGETPGSRIAGTAGRPSSSRVDAATACSRAWRCALRESSILVELLAATERGQHCLRALRALRV